VKRASRVIVAALVAAAGLTATAGPSGAADACSAQATKVLSGVQPRFTTTLNPNEHVDANAATWAGNPSGSSTGCRRTT